MFHLDYVSCILTVISTVLIGRKQWTGLLVGGINCLVICAIGWKTSQFGFIPANVFCIGVYGFSIRSWVKQTGETRLSRPARGIFKVRWAQERSAAIHQR